MRRFDWRWVALIIGVAVLANARSLPWQLVAVLLGSAGGYLIWMSIRAWRRTAPARPGTRVTYWRGQRIETRQTPQRGGRMPPIGDLAYVLVYGLLGLALVLAGVQILVTRIG